MSDPRPACEGRWALFDSTHAADHKRAAEFCKVCPIRLACRALLDDARRDQLMTNYGPEGTWAGQLLKAKGSGA